MRALVKEGPRPGMVLRDVPRPTCGPSDVLIRVHHAGEYPKKLRDARHPVELLYYRGIWELTETRCIAVVGSRKPTPDGVKRATQLARELVAANFTVVSGLATGIDAAAQQ